MNEPGTTHLRASNSEGCASFPSESARLFPSSADDGSPSGYEHQLEHEDESQRYGRVLRSLRIAQRSEERYRQSHAGLAAALHEAQDEAGRWRARCAELEQAISLRMEKRFRPVLERFVPVGSLRRRGCRRVLTALGLRPPRDGGATTAASPVPTIPMALQPEVSIIIPVHNRWDLTAGCLRSIADAIAAVGYEVIVVDDASDDETPERLRGVVGVNVVRLDQNKGFLGAVNCGIDAARGRFIVLLNNDTLVQPGWLDALVRVAERDDMVGVVGAKLVYPDGRLQEAGGIIFRDGSGHNYGRDQDPDDPRFNFVREVDYCSGACLLVRRELLRSMGGLDTRFSPAYYEDTDLCFSARKLGYRVLYQPDAVVCHFEGASHGTDVSIGIKQYQAINMGTFQDKWAEELERHATHDPGHVRLASWRTDAGRVVVVDHQIPMPDHDSGSRRMLELLVLLQDLGFGVTFVPQNGVTIPQYRDHLQALGIEVLGGPGDLDRYLQEIGDGLPLAVLSRPTVAWANLPMFRSLVPGTKIVYDTVDLHFVRERRRADVEDDTGAHDSARFHYDMELTLARLADAVWVVSEDEQAMLLKEDSSLNVSVVPNIHREEPPGPAFEGREGLLFVGSFPHAPNRDAALWLAQEILPLVHESIPDVALYLVGSHPTDDILALDSADVHVLGWVSDLEDLYHRTRLFVAPIRYGAGMKGKIGESLAYGLPVVTTTLGSEGMRLEHGRDVLLADDAEGLARAAVAAYHDAPLWDRLAANGQRAITDQFSPSRVREELIGILDRLGVYKRGSDPSAS